MEKAYVRSLFDSIAYRYDLLNHLLSGGIDLYWRRKAVEQLQDLHPKRILDVATGTADFAIAAMKLSPEKVVGVDISEKMLTLGREKIHRRNMDSMIELVPGDAENLQFETGSFDAAIVAFGVRNFEDLEAGLKEIFRVLRPGGKFVVLEFSRPSGAPFKQLYLFYFRRVLPLIGRLISRHPDAYQYLRDSVMRFPEGSDFRDALRQTGFVHPRETRLTFGIATVYSGIKL